MTQRSTEYVWLIVLIQYSTKVVHGSRKNLLVSQDTQNFCSMCCSNVKNKKTQMLHKFFWLKEVFQYNIYVTCRINYLSVKKFPQLNALTQKLKCYISLYGQHKYIWAHSIDLLQDFSMLPSKWQFHFAVMSIRVQNRDSKYRKQFVKWRRVRRTPVQWYRRSTAKSRAKQVLEHLLIANLMVVTVYQNRHHVLTRKWAQQEKQCGNFNKCLWRVRLAWGH